MSESAVSDTARAPLPVISMRQTSAWPLALVYAVLIVFASLFPFDGWRAQGIDPRVFLFAKIPPPYWTWFDVNTNIVGYAPLGFFLALALMRSGKPRLAVPLAFLAGTLLRWSAFRSKWLGDDGAGVLVLLALWPFALLFPAAVPFGLGQVLERLDETLQDWLLNTPFEDWLPLGDFAMMPLSLASEMLCVMLGLWIPCLLAYCAVRHMGRRALAGLLLVAAGVGVTALSAALSWGPAHAWEWVDMPVRLGIWGGLGLAIISLPASRRICAVLLLLVLVLHLSILNQAPTNVYFAQTLQAWEQGRFIRFYGLGQWLGWLWPYVTLAYVVVRASRRQQPA